MMVGSGLRLRAPADPPLGVTVRTFVASSSRYLGLDPELCEDLRLAANEIFAAATEAGGAIVDLRIDGGPGEATLTVTGVPDLDSGPDDLPRTRRDLLLALFPGLHLEEGTLVIRAGLDAS